jgi:hypothetical protein
VVVGAHGLPAVSAVSESAAGQRHETRMLIKTPLLLSGSLAATRVDPTSRAWKGATVHGSATQGALAC